MTMSGGIAGITLKLDPSTYEYKYYVKVKPDTLKRWFTDDNAKIFDDDGYGGKNSVIKPTEKTKVTFTFNSRRFMQRPYM